jgi:hypothetical protein
LFDALDGVIEALIPVDVYVARVVEKGVEYKTCTTCKTDPVGKATLAKAVALLRLIAEGVPKLVADKGLVNPLESIVDTAIICSPALQSERLVR